MNRKEIEQWSASQDQFLALREAFAALVYTLAEQGALDLERYKHHLELSVKHLEENGDKTAPAALAQLAEVLLDDAHQAAFQALLARAKEKRDRTWAKTLATHASPTGAGSPEEDSGGRQ